MKLLLTFEKGEPVRWLGHLDVMRAFERAIRRSGLPIAFTTGFNPRERLSFASALGVGVTGGAERAVVELTADVPAGDAMATLNAVLPSGLHVLAAEPIPDAGSRDRLNAYCKAEVDLACTWEDPAGLAVLQAAVDAALAREEWMVEREKDNTTRRLNIRPFVLSLAVLRCEADELVLRVVAELGQSGAARPAEIVSMLAGDLPGLRLRRAHRVRLLVSDERDRTADNQSDFSLKGGEHTH